MNAKHHEQARTIVQAHTHLALNPGAVDRLERPDIDRQVANHPADPETHIAPAEPTKHPSVYPAVWTACLALDFAPDDARCIAQAWQRQTERTGHFDAQAWPTEAQDFDLPPWPHPDAFAPCPLQLGLYAVAPNAAWVGRLARAGVPTVQLRFKSDGTYLIAQEVNLARAAVQNTSSRLFINDHWQAAIEAGVYGVHLGQEDMATADLGAIRAAGLRLGVSSHGYTEMLRAAALHPSYIAMGAVFATTLKRMVTPPQGVARLTVYQQLLRHMPTVAIGGIDLTRVAAVLASGVGSVAVVRALLGADDPEAAVHAFQSRWP